MAPMTSQQLRNLADALDDLAKIRIATDVTPGASFERERVSLGDDTWVLTWIQDGESEFIGHYQAELDHA